MEPVKKERELLPYIAYFLLTLILLSLSWLEFEPHHLRIEITLLTTILIAIGEYHEVNWENTVALEIFA